MAQTEGLTKAVVSLTYDGTQLCHSETVLPHVDENGLKATFFADPLNMLESLPAWRDAVRNGHEIGNGCLLEAGPLEAWTSEMLADDLEETDNLLTELFPAQSSFSFGYPWSVTEGRNTESLRRIIEVRHAVCRSGEHGTNNPDSVDLSFLHCVSCEGQAACELIDTVRSSIRLGHWIILAFCGVGSGEPSIDSAVHRELCEWLGNNRELVRVLTLSQMASEVQQSASQKVRLL